MVKIKKTCKKEIDKFFKELLKQINRIIKIIINTKI